MSTMMQDDVLFGDFIKLMFDSPPEGEPHHHMCPITSCGFMWSHKRSDLKTSEEFEKGHTCPVCGTPQTFKCDANGRPL